MNLLKVVSKLDWGADWQVLLRLYRSFVRSKLDYGSLVYGSARKSYLRKLDAVQNQALRLCLGAFRTSPVDSLHVEANEMPPHLRRQKLALQYALKIKSTPNNPVHDTIFNPNYAPLYEKKPNTIPSFGIRIKESLQKVCNDPNIIAQNEIPEIPPWTLPSAVVDLSLTADKKDISEAPYLLNKFRELKHKYSNHKFVYTDGSKDANNVGAGVVMGEVSHKTGLHKDATVFTAELVAIKEALGLIAHENSSHFVIFSDSLSALEAIKGKNCDTTLVIDILVEVFNLLNSDKHVVFAWVPSHVGIPGNEKADQTAKAALNEPVSDIRIPYTDLGARVREFVRNSWQELWDQCEHNKLHAVFPTLGEWKGGIRANRREEVVLARARIGHTHMTHSFLLKNEDIPECYSCGCYLTVKHFLVDCDDYAHIRRRYYNVRDVKELFDSLNPLTVLAFIRDSGLFHRF